MHGKTGELEASRSDRRARTTADAASWKCLNSDFVASRLEANCQDGLECVISVWGNREDQFLRVDVEETSQRSLAYEMLQQCQVEAVVDDSIFGSDHGCLGQALVPADWI